MEWLGGRIDKQAVEQVTGLKIITPLIGHIPQGLDDLLIPALGHFQLAELTQGELAKKSSVKSVVASVSSGSHAGHTSFAG